MNVSELLAARKNDQTLHMRFPSDPDTTRRLEAVVKWKLNSDAGLPLWRRILRWLRR
jgi:hypothetical protein